MLNKIMSEKNETLIKSSLIFTITSIINSSIPFLLLPVLTRYLSPADYGIVSVFTVLLSITSAFIGVNADGAVARNYFDLTKEEMKQYITSTFLIVIASIILVSFFFIFIGNIISNLLSLPLILIWATIAIAGADFIVKVNLKLWQVQKKALIFGIFNIKKTVINVVLSLLFIVYYGLAWEGRILAIALTSLIFSMVGLVVLIKNNWLGIYYKKKYIKDALHFGLPLIPHTIGGIVVAMVDRLFITSYLGLESTGLYTVGYQIGAVVSLIAVSFNNAYAPWLFEKLKNASLISKIKIVKFTYFYAVFLLLLVLSVSIVSLYILPFLLGPEFQKSIVFVSRIALAYAFHAMYFMFVGYIFYTKKTKYLTYTTVSLAIINITLNFIFVPIFGAIGAANATIIAYFIQFIMIWFFAQKVYEMPWNPMKWKVQGY